ncbi:MAG: SDR family NAD(P)-dependent oxidoreductase [Bacteroidales bacterium]|nr:SDR family NAD(P)-dependent oxidoreductase [Bacteroidales bacterium]
MTNKLEGKVAVVTGSGQGVGKGIALVLAREGAKVLTNNRKPKSGIIENLDILTDAEKARYNSLSGDAESTAKEIINAGGDALPFFGDVSDHETSRNMIRTAIEKWGRIDILINNAAGLGSGMLVETTEKDWDHLMIPKLKGAYNTMKHAIPYMVQQKFGRIINVSSDAWIGLAGLTVYSAANAGLVGFSKAAAKELNQFGITVNTICPQTASPGHILNFTIAKKKIEAILGAKKMDQEKLKAIEEAHAAPDKAAPFVAYLCTQEAEFINGAVFTVTGDSRVTLYTEPAEAASIKKDDGPWDIDELIEAVPKSLLSNYISIVKKKDW